MLIAAVHREGLQQWVDEHLFSAVLQKVVKQCTEDLGKRAARHEEGALRVSVDDTKLNKTNLEDQRQALNKDMDEFQLHTHNEFTKFLKNLKDLVSEWSPILAKTIEGHEEKAESLWKDIRKNAQTSWSSKLQKLEEAPGCQH